MKFFLSFFSLVLLTVSGFSYTVSGNTYATNGSRADVQSACKSAPAGAVISLPSGSFSWVKGITVNKALTITGTGAWTGGSGVALSGGTQITCRLPANGGAMITINSGAGGPPYPLLENLALIDGRTDTNGYLVVVGGSGSPLVTGCYIDVKGSVDQGIRWMMNGGVIWNNTFYASEVPNAEPLAFYNLSDNPSPDWQSPDSMGTADTDGTVNTYVESNTWNNCFNGAFDLADNARVVIRYNTFNNSSGSSHGQDTCPQGVRQFEIYSNTFVFTTRGKDPAGTKYPLNINWWMLLRGGTGVIWGNVFPAISSEQWGDKGSVVLGDFNVNQIPNAVPCQTTYPSAEQIGQTYIGPSGYAWQTPGTQAVDGSGYGTEPVYMWGNTGKGDSNIGLQETTDSDFPGDNCGNGESTSTFIQANRDYIVGQAKPGYTPYPYPHPLESYPTSPLKVDKVGN